MMLYDKMSMRGMFVYENILLILFDTIIFLHNHLQGNTLIKNNRHLLCKYVISHALSPVRLILFQ